MIDVNGVEIGCKLFGILKHPVLEDFLAVATKDSFYVILMQLKKKDSVAGYLSFSDGHAFGQYCRSFVILGQCDKF